jgi:hypothetical protein
MPGSTAFIFDVIIFAHCEYISFWEAARQLSPQTARSSSPYRYGRRCMCEAKSATMRDGETRAATDRGGKSYKSGEEKWIEVKGY